MHKADSLTAADDYCTAGNRFYEDIIIRLNINSVLACFSSPYVEKEELLFSDSLYIIKSLILVIQLIEGSNIIFHSLTFTRSQGPEGSVENPGVANVIMNDKIMFDCYYCINSTKHCKNEENIGTLYFITS